jgi:hypothetical protein
MHLPGCVQTVCAGRGERDDHALLASWAFFSLGLDPVGLCVEHELVCLKIDGRITREARPGALRAIARRRVV